MQMAILDDLPNAPDGRPIWLPQRYGSIYTWGRPPMPGQCADTLAAVLNKYCIRSALVLGSCCPSILTAIGFGSPERRIRMLDQRSRWWDGYGAFVEDCDNPDGYPAYDSWLPHEQISTLMEWSWKPCLGEMIFVDLPGSSRLIDADLVAVVRSVDPWLIAMGFMENHPGPNELESHLRADGWEMAEETGYLINHETGERITYRLVFAKHAQAESDPYEDRNHFSACKHLDIL
jgi:hypothetical protein